MAAVRLLKRSKTPQSFASQCELVTTPQGRTAHYRHPQHGVMCGWPAGSWIPAGPGLAECQACVTAVQAEDAWKAAT